MNPSLIRGLYALVDTAWLQPAALADATGAAIRGGARLVQYRDKDASPGERAERARAVFRVCRQLGAVFIVNDDVDLADELMAHGVHLGEHDATVAVARARLGPLAIVGASCYDSVVNAQRAADAGASYLAFGAFFPTRTKSVTREAHPVLLRKAKAFGLPLVAIGGITPENAPELIVAGADAIAVAGGLYQGADVDAAARAYSLLFER
ncbi:MAG: thiamine phosphate synthase [Xanthomonadales bacterium]|nr:Thiamine-phosphate synthase [Xanthomonadales bacterium]MCC6594641.1 thiamine phosphate synthase [Xanthomonadales bacterium]MCE7932258.1 thiamine phosphate synthase [Xanthomonadales bacterium PRO6]